MLAAEGVLIAVTRMSLKACAPYFLCSENIAHLGDVVSLAWLEFAANIT